MNWDEPGEVDCERERLQRDADVPPEDDEELVPPDDDDYIWEATVHGELDDDE